MNARKRPLELLYFFIVLVVIVCWIKRGYNKGSNEYFNEKKKLIKGRIIRMERTSQEKKFVKVQFSDSSWYDVPVFGFEDRVQAGDSLYKAANSYHYTIFRNTNPSDSFSFEWRNSLLE